MGHIQHMLVACIAIQWAASTASNDSSETTSRCSIWMSRIKVGSDPWASLVLHHQKPMAAQEMKVPAYKPFVPLYARKENSSGGREREEKVKDDRNKRSRSCRAESASWSSGFMQHLAFPGATAFIGTTRLECSDIGERGSASSSCHLGVWLGGGLLRPVHFSLFYLRPVYGISRTPNSVKHRERHPEVRGGWCGMLEGGQWALMQPRACRRDPAQPPRATPRGSGPQGHQLASCQYQLFFRTLLSLAGC